MHLVEIHLLQEIRVTNLDFTGLKRSNPSTSGYMCQTATVVDGKQPIRRTSARWQPQQWKPVDCLSEGSTKEIKRKSSKYLLKRAEIEKAQKRILVRFERRKLGSERLVRPAKTVIVNA